MESSKGNEVAMHAIYYISYALCEICLSRSAFRNRDLNIPNPFQPHTPATLSGCMWHVECFQGNDSRPRSSSE